MFEALWRSICWVRDCDESNSAILAYYRDNTDSWTWCSRRFLLESVWNMIGVRSFKTKAKSRQLAHTAIYHCYIPTTALERHKDPLTFLPCSFEWPSWSGRCTRRAVSHDHSTSSYPPFHLCSSAESPSTPPCHCQNQSWPEKSSEWSSLLREKELQTRRFPHLLPSRRLNAIIGLRRAMNIGGSNLVIRINIECLTLHSFGG